MRTRRYWRLALALALPLGAAAGWSAPRQAPAPTTRPAAARYTYRQDHDPDGTGKFYLGREIAQVMGHQAADWLDRPEREQEERVTTLVASLPLKPGDVVADVGAGTGYLSFLMSPRVGPKGKVLAVDIQREMLHILSGRMKERGVKNVHPVLGTITDPKLPTRGVDLILMVDVYHEFSHPYEMTRSMVRSLKPGGRLAFVEYRLEDPSVPIKLVHKMSEAQVKKEMALFPELKWEKTLTVLPRQHIILFQRK